jgi:hypothetical protein
MAATMEGHKALENEMRAAGKYRGGGGLGLVHSASTVRFRDGTESVTDGPFAETKEQFGGFYMVEAESPEEAIAYARRIPGVANRAIEVRPFMHFSPQ